MTEHTNICDKCGDEYESYLVLLRRNFSDVAAHATCEYDNLCKSCRFDITDYGAYLTESELKELSADE